MRAEQQAAPTRPPPAFECNICLDTVVSPVVTLCGHLYWYVWCPRSQPSYTRHTCASPLIFLYV